MQVETEMFLKREFKISTIRNINTLFSKKILKIYCNTIFITTPKNLTSKLVYNRACFPVFYYQQLFGLPS